MVVCDENHLVKIKDLVLLYLNLFLFFIEDDMKLLLRIICLTLLVFTISFTGCRKPPKHSTPEAIVNKETRAFMAPTDRRGKFSIPRKYGVKSGIVEYNIENNFLNAPIKGVLYFDNYGELEFFEETSEIEAMGHKIKNHSIRIIREGIVATIDMIKKTGNRRRITSFRDLYSFDFSKYNEESLVGWEIKKGEEEMILNKKGNTYIFSKGDMKGKVVLWQGINLMSEIEKSGDIVKSLATNIEVGVKIESSKFEIPKEIRM